MVGLDGGAIVQPPVLFNATEDCVSDISDNRVQARCHVD